MLSAVKKWVKDNAAPFEVGFRLRELAQRLASRMREQGWITRSDPLSSLAQARKPRPLPNRTGLEEMVANLQQYQLLASPDALEKLDSARKGLAGLGGPEADTVELDPSTLQSAFRNISVSASGTVTLAAFRRAVLGSLFDPADDRHVRGVAHLLTGALPPASSIPGQGLIASKDVTEALEGLRRDYELAQRSSFVSRVAREYVHQGSANRNYGSLDTALADDFRNLTDIHLVFLASTPSRVGSDIVLDAIWSRTAIISRGGQHWKVLEQPTRLVFRKIDGKMQLVRTEGQLPFGLTGRFGVLTIDRGNIDGVPVTAQHPWQLRNGVVTQRGAGHEH